MAGEKDQAETGGGVGRKGRTVADEEAAAKVARERAALKAARLAARAKATSERAAAGEGGGGEDPEDGDSSETVSELSEDSGEDDTSEWWVPRIMKGAAWAKVTRPSRPSRPLPEGTPPLRLRVGAPRWTACSDGAWV